MNRLTLNLRWDKWDTWEGNYANSRLPSDYDKFGFGAPESSPASSRRSTARPSSSESPSSSSATEYDPFSYHSNRKSKMRKGFKTTQDLRPSYSHRSDSRMSAGVPHYITAVAERRSDSGGRLPLPEYGHAQGMAYSGQPALAEKMAATNSGSYFYYPETFRSAAVPITAIAPWHHKNIDALGILSMEISSVTHEDQMFQIMNRNCSLGSTSRVD